MAIKCLTPVEQTAVIKSHKNGNSHADIAAAFGVGVTTVRRVLAEHKVIPPLAFHKTKDEVEMLEVLMLSGISTANQLRKKLGLVQAPTAQTLSPATTGINVAAFKAGDQYFSVAEGWITIKECEFDDKEDQFCLYDQNNSALFVNVSGCVIDRDYSEYDITDHRAA